MIEAPELPERVRASLPTFFVIGAAKTGTTSLHEYLAAHPEVAMTTEKEPSVFELMRLWRERLHEYPGLYDRDAEVRGESSTAYSAYPWQADVPDRIKSVVPDARFIYLVREPVTRMLSHYHQNVWDEKGQRPFAEVLEDLEGEWNMPVWSSRFATQVERYHERFGPDSVLVIDNRELLRDRPAAMRRIFAFLGVEPSFTSPAWDAMHNTAASHRRPVLLAHRLRLAGRPALERAPLKQLFTREVPVPTLSDAERERLREFFRPEVERLRELTGLELAHWGY